MRTNPVGVGAKTKLDRAEFHLKLLREQVNSGKHNAGQVAYRVDYEGQELVVFTRPDKTSVRWAVVAGEIIHQSRSALDHIVWELIAHNGSMPKEGVTGFPIFWEEAKYKSRFNGMIKGINPQALAIIDGLQPLGPDYATDPLYVLNEMWNRDKHRLLNTAVYAVAALKIHFLFPDRLRNLMIDIPDGPLPEGTEIERRSLPFYLPREVKVTGTVAIIHKFVGGPAAGKPFLETLSNLYEFAESVIDKLIATAS